jgi:hypothetical protein
VTDLADTEHRWKACTKNPAETKPVELRALTLCKKFWQADEQYEAGEFVWPAKATGFVLECTTPGRSAATEPRTRLLPASTAVPDGSVVWTVRVPTLTDGIQPITDVAAAPPTGIQVAGITISEGTKLLVDYAGGTAGKSYDVPFTITIAGRPRVGTQTVFVANK